ATTYFLWILPRNRFLEWADSAKNTGQRLVALFGSLQDGASIKQVFWEEPVGRDYGDAFICRG
mgnify:CR=1